MSASLCLASTALIALTALLLACSEPPPSDADRAAPDAGLWAATGQSDNELGFALRMEPGARPDQDDWRILINGVDLACKPQARDSDWLLGDCRDLPEEVTVFEVEVPYADSESIAVRLNSGEGPFSASFRSVPNREEPISSPHVQLAWYRQTDERCGAHLGVWAESNLVYAACAGGSVEILDGRSGELRGRADLGNTAVLEVTARNGRLFAASTSEGVVAFDVSSSATPRRLGAFKLSNGEGSPASVTNVHTLTLTPRGDLLYAVNQSHPRTDVRILDVTDPSLIREVARHAPSNSAGILGGAHDVYFEERGGRLLAYLHQLNAGFYILDVTDPRQIRQLGWLFWNGTLSHSGWPFQSGGRFYYAHNDEGYDQGLSVIDVTDPAAPRVVSTFKSRRGISIHNIRVVDGIAYVSYYVDGLRVIDLRDPEKPREIGHFDTVPPEFESALFQGAWGVHLDGGLVYISDMDTGVYAFRWQP